MRLKTYLFNPFFLYNFTKQVTGHYEAIRLGNSEALKDIVCGCYLFCFGSNYTAATVVQCNAHMASGWFCICHGLILAKNIIDRDFFGSF